MYLYTAILTYRWCTSDRNIKLDFPSENEHVQINITTHHGHGHTAVLDNKL